MLQTHFSRSVFALHPPPLWYVSNGDLTVGPVNTGLLVRGVEQGRVPEYCHVRAFTGDWRELHRVREIAAKSSKAKTSGPSPEQLAEWGEAVERVRDEGELCHTATWLCAAATGADNAMMHYRGRHGRTLFTRAIFGPVPDGRIGYPLSEFDPVLRSARRGIPIQGPASGPAADELGKRFSTSQQDGAVAMIPVFVAGQLSAMLELSRTGHAFRCSDLQRAERIIRRALRAHSVR